MLTSVVNYLNKNYPELKYGKYLNNYNGETIYFKSLFDEEIYTEIWEKENHIELKTFLIKNADDYPVAYMYSKIYSFDGEDVFDKVKNDSSLLKKL